MSKKRPRSRLRGSLMIDILVGLVIMGLLAAIMLPNLPAWRRASEAKQMVAKAHILQASMSSFMSEQTVRDALTAWRAADNEGRYQLLRPYLEDPPEQLSQYGVEGFVIVFPADPRGHVSISDPDGAAIAY